MVDYKRLGDNIKALRVAFGETQEQLAECLNLSGRSAIRNYESGERQPSKEIISEIAKHYVVPVDILLYSDLSQIGEIHVGDKLLWNYIDLLFPLISTTEANQNADFARALKKHEKMFELMKKITIETIDDDRGVFDDLVWCIEKYESAMEDETSRACAAANKMACVFILLICVRLVPEIYINRPAPFTQAANNNSKIRKIIDNTADGFTEDMKRAAEYFKDDEIDSELEEILLILKESGEFADLAYYYSALRYVYNIVNNDMKLELNQTIGFEMMYSYLSMENKYAINFVVANRLLTN